jgi:hypothetical protein
LVGAVFKDQAVVAVCGAGFGGKGSVGLRADYPRRQEQARQSYSQQATQIGGIAHRLTV